VTRTKFGDHAFSAAGPTVWNSLLPESVRSAEAEKLSVQYFVLTCFYHLLPL